MKTILFILIIVSPYAASKVKIDEEFIYYSVTPKSKKQLLSSLNTATPIREGDDIFHGNTKYYIKWRFWWRSLKNSCQFTKVNTHLTLTYTMPKLDSSNTAVINVWNKWYPNLSIHEKGHGTLAIETAKEIDNVLLSIGARTSCEQLEADANKLANKLMSELKSENKHYDVKTNHGESQKAWLYTHL
ncbi:MULTISPECIES: DUF922 domain-containing Zn-dependent protease [unclassified Pseudoalteromonas]|uniref:DUF922 domain-containing Zn-dependent protease n=1 Tax=unclassified Pseudoalteromonas TaxID=194690 RepID=UPI0005A615CC|nr:MULTISPECIES: DUF922 domain-containing protein [unclassified Pseudoalteromonas]